MNFDWTAVKEAIWELYGKLSQVLVFLILCSYLGSCVVAMRPVGPRGYVSFVYHCFQWHGDVKKSAPKVFAKER